jgi:hypothetical protein
MNQTDDQEANNENKKPDEDVVDNKNSIIIEIIKTILFITGIKLIQEYIPAGADEDGFVASIPGIILFLYEIGYFDFIGKAIYNFYFPPSEIKLDLHKYTKYYSTIIHFKDELLFDDLFNARPLYKNMHQQKTKLEEQQIKYDVLLKILLEHIRDQKASKDRGLIIN